MTGLAVRNAELDRVRSTVAAVPGIEALIAREVDKARKLSAEFAYTGEQGHSIGYAHVAHWLIDFARELKLNVDDTV